MCGAGHDDGGRVDSRSVLWDLLDEGVGEDVLGDGDGDGAAERVEEDGHGVADRHVLLVQHDLHGDEGDLDTGARARPGQDLIPDPRPRRGVDLQRVQEARANGEDGGADPGERHVRAQSGDAAADDDRGDCDADQVGNGADAGLFRRRALDRLEVEGQIIDVGVQAHGEEGGEKRAHEHGSLPQHDPRRQRREVALPQLDAGEHQDQQPEAQQTSPDLGVGPGVDRATPLEGEEEADDGADEEEGADEVDLADLLLQGQVAVFADRILEKEKHRRDRDRPDGQVDIEAPAPRDTWEGGINQSARCAERDMCDHANLCGWMCNIRSVKAPPKIGPTTEAIPNMELKRPI